MSDLLIYLLVSVVLLVAAFGIVKNLRSGSDKSRKTHESRIDAMRKAAVSHPVHSRLEHAKNLKSTPSATMVSTAESATRALIGDEIFETMKVTVSNLLEHHKADKSLTISLTSGCESRQAARVLHSLLPGDELCLRRNVECGLELVDVYAAGFRIGRLVLGDAERAFNIMRRSEVTGVYVAEQNCYGECSGVDMKIILFFSSRVPFDTMEAEEQEAPYKITVGGTKPIVLFQN